MLALTNDQLAIQPHAEPLRRQDRDAYLRRVADLLNGHEIGDGLVSRCAGQAQREFFDRPRLDKYAEGARSKYR
jgi:hypothetical protein